MYPTKNEISERNNSLKPNDKYINSKDKKNHFSLPILINRIVEPNQNNIEIQGYK
jgi:hypothetical protein